MEPKFVIEIGLKSGNKITNIYTKFAIEKRDNEVTKIEAKSIDKNDFLFYISLSDIEYIRQLEVR